MTALPTSRPSPELGSALHRGLLEHDPVAPSEFAMAYLDYLAGHLAARNPGIERQYCDTAAGDAILALIKNPAAYDPARGDLDTYLRMAAQGDLKNLLRREQRHRSRRASWEAVEKSPDLGNELGDVEGDPARIVEAHETVMERQAAQQHVSLADLTPEEERVLALLDAGERRTDLYAAALGIAHLPFAEQQRRVKQIKDRLKKRRERARNHG
jgi:hypothetical protein